MSADLGSFFKRYGELYMAGDADSVADMYEAPFLAVREGRSIHLSDRAAVVDHLTGLMAAYRAAGGAAADIADLDVLEQGDSAAVATVRWRVRSADGAVIRELQTSYQMLGPDPWRILAYVNHDTVTATRPQG